MKIKLGTKARIELLVIESMKKLRLVSRQRARVFSDYVTVESSPFFDWEWYVKTYPDVAKGKIDPIFHYLHHGWKEGRSPGPLFDGAWYLKQYPDVAKAKMNPLVHYMRYGVNHPKGRFKTHPIPKAVTPRLMHNIISKSSLFDASFYAKRARLPESTPLAQLVDHYLTIGAKRDYPPSENFNGSLYLAENPDVAEAGMNPLAHYLIYGQHGGRHCEALESARSKKFKSRPLVSIVVASYNYEDFIQETLDSLLTQSYGNFEIIVVDDGSKDNSVDVIRGYERLDPRIHLYQHSGGTNKGLPATVKLGVSKAKGEYIAFCESDDKWTANHLEEKVAMINEFGGAPKVIINDIEPFGDEGRCRAAANTTNVRMKAMPEKRNRISPADFRSQNWICTFSCCMVAADVLRECDYDNCPRPPNLDWWLWRQVCCVNDIFVVHSKLTKWRMHDSYMTKESMQSILLQREFLGRMDRILAKRYPDATADLRKIIDDEDRFSFVNGLMLENGVKVENAPSFSVVMATWNRAFCICTAIDSLLKQTYQNFELVIVDDGSTDGTAELLDREYAKEIKRGKIRVVPITNRGVCKARNVALKHVKNDWVAYLDSDNEICPFFLETFARAIMLNPGTYNFYAKLICKESHRGVGKKFDLDDLIKANFIDLGVYVHRRRLIGELGPFDENMTRLVDWELIVRQCKQHTPIFIDTVVMIYNDDKGFMRITNSVSLKKNMDYFRIKHCGWPSVTTMITTYNHEKYIKRAIESAIMQKGDFVHEILVSDDGSTDGTRAVIKELMELYPGCITDISSDENVGISANMRKCFTSTTTDYVAVLEGDDYWITPWKLNRQINFMRRHPKCSMCFSRIKLRNQDDKFSLLPRQKLPEIELTGEDFIRDPNQNIIANFSCCMFKADIARNFPDILYSSRFNEIACAFYIEQKGPIGFLPDIMSVYRLHDHGVWSSIDKVKQFESAIKSREVALAVCAPQYKERMQKVIDWYQGRLEAAIQEKGVANAR